MTITFIDPDPTHPAAVDALETRLGSRLPAAFRDLLVNVSNGGEVEQAAAEPASDVGVVAVLGAERGDHLDLETRIAQYQGGRLPDGLVPVADAEGGNLVCISVRSHDFGTVWFWDHQRELAGDAMTQIAADFDAFLADLAPIGEGEEPSAVTEAWIDPSLEGDAPVRPLGRGRRGWGRPVRPPRRGR